VWLDVVTVYPESMRSEAIRAGVAANQKAIADLEAIYRQDWAHAFIDTGGTGQTTKYAVLSPKLLAKPTVNK
jgi:hypothetical protein